VIHKIVCQEMIKRVGITLIESTIDTFDCGHGIKIGHGAIYAGLVLLAA
jgi:hypothetical protein